MREIVVQVRFKGDVKVLVPEHLEMKRAVYLAQQLAVSHAVAVIDADTEVVTDACEEYVQHGGKPEDFEASKCETIGGCWDVVGIDRALDADDR